MDTFFCVYITLWVDGSCVPPIHHTCCVLCVSFPVSTCCCVDYPVARSCSTTAPIRAYQALEAANASTNMAMEESDPNMKSYSWADVEVAEVRTGMADPLD